MLGSLLHGYGPDVQATCGPKTRQTDVQTHDVHSTLKFFGHALNGAINHCPWKMCLKSKRRTKQFKKQRKYFLET